MKKFSILVTQWGFTGLLVLFTAFSMSVKAQVYTRTIASSELARFGVKQLISSDKVSTRQLPTFNLKAELTLDSLDGLRGLPKRFGKAQEISVDMMNEGNQIIVEDTVVTTFLIDSKEAKSINLIFDQFFLSKNAKIFIYNKDKTLLYGPVIATNNPKNGVFWSDIIRGSGIFIQHLSPISEKGQSKLHISHAIQGYNTEYIGYGSSADCNRDIACSEGSGWQNEASSVALMLLGTGDRFCTGTLINNACQDFTPYFLTAFHCLDLDRSGNLSTGEMGDVANWAFRFHYNSSTCGGGDASTWITFNSATFRAAHVDSDFSLLEFAAARPTPVMNISYAGWSRSTTAASSAVTIHHPAGDVKKISVTTNALSNITTTTTWGTFVTCPANTHWQATFQTGTVQPGSSGAPIFDQNKRIVGQLHGDTGNTCVTDETNPFYDKNCFCTRRVGMYGRFDVSWNGGGTNNTRLSNWLDPANTGLTDLATISTYPSVSGPTLLCSTGTFTLNNVPPGAAVTWVVNPAGAVITASGTGATANVTYGSPQNARITFNVGCSPGAPFNFDFRTGGPSFVMSVDGVNTNSAYVSSGSYHSLNAATLSSGSTSYNYSDYSGSGDMSISLSPSGSYAYVYVNGSSTTGHREVMVQGTNSCGTINQMVYLYLSGMFRMYPNPVKSDLTLEFSNTQVKETLPTEIALLAEQSTTPAITIPVWDYFDKKLFKDANKIMLDVSQLQRGTYYLHVKYSDTQAKPTERIRVILE